jgi:hypothetical protein
MKRRRWYVNLKLDEKNEKEEEEEEEGRRKSSIN